MICIENPDGSRLYLTEKEYAKHYGALPKKGAHHKEAQTLKEARVQLEIGFMELAGHMGVSVTWLYFLENGMMPITPETRQEYQKAILLVELSRMDIDMAGE